MKVIVLLLLTCELCWTIRVPVSWHESESDVKSTGSDEEFSVESFKPQKLQSEGDSHEAVKTLVEETKPQIKSPVPVEYFEYTAKKPQFAVDVAAFHGVQSPENHYKAYPIRPHTGRVKPELGKHHILNSKNTLHKPFQDYTKINENVNQANPVSSSYEVFHPYEAETPALKEIYRDPVLNKIRSDLENSRSRLQQYEKDAGEPNITKDEYLESPQRTDDKLFPQRHRPVPFEIHRPQRRPVYYRPSPVQHSREQYLNQKLRSPWNHNIAKVRPVHYRPIQNHIHHLRQQHALKYDDERNEYPQVQIYEDNSDPKDGHDIYEKGRDKFLQLRNNVDESINNAVKENRPTTFQKLEVQDNDSASASDEEDDEDEYVPIKNYAQARRTETFRHLPRSAALEDAESFDEIKNSPRLREAIKSTKAQTVYTEEGYEDAAYDHAGEQKHASENEGHGGFLKEHELSGGKYKAPTVSANYNDGEGSIYRDENIHAEKWKDDNKDTKEEADEEDYTENEHEHLLEADNLHTEPNDEDNHRNKRENSFQNETLSSSDISSNSTNDSQHEVDKREVNFEVPQVDLNSTFFKDSDFNKLAKLKFLPKKDTIKQKYPYYFKNLKAISENSPLKYAENLKFIPKKTKGGTEFYDSRSKFECPEVDEVPDPVPEKLKGDGHPNDGDDKNEKQSSGKGDENFDTAKKQPRLKGLGDKIDCFKAKYFGENPLDSPFFKEDVISNPEPVFLPNIASYKLKTTFLPKFNGEVAKESKRHNVFEIFNDNNTSDLFDLINKLRSEQSLFQISKVKSNNESELLLEAPNNHSIFNSSKLADQSSVYNDVIKNIKTSFLDKTQQTSFDNLTQDSNTLSVNNSNNNITYTHFQNKEDITKSPLSRKRRATSFVYEPYKIIRDSQLQDDLKKSAIASNVSPLIRQLQQSSRVIEAVNKLHPEEMQHTKRNVNPRGYKDIGQKDREIKYGSSKNDKNFENTEIVDISIDKRRGEPRYEIRHENHKPRYTPIKNQKAMSKKDYEAQINDDESPKTSTRGESIPKRLAKQRKPTEEPYFDVSKFIPQRGELQNTTEIYPIKEPLSKVTSTEKPRGFSFVVEKGSQDSGSEGDEDYEEYDEDEPEVSKEISSTSTTTTTSTTSKPLFRRKIRTKTTIQEPRSFVEEPRLKLVTRFRNYTPKDQEHSHHNLKQNEGFRKRPIEEIDDKESSNDDKTSPKIREKKKKVTESTTVTDTKRYGDVLEDRDKMMKDEVDELIGVKQDMDDYEPIYEKEEEYKAKARTLHENQNKEHGKDDVANNDSEEIDEDEAIDDDDEEDDEEDEDEDIDDDEDDDDVNDDESDSDSASASEEENVKIDEEPHITTPEPTKRTLVITTDAPIPTIATRSAKLQARPIITRKKIEIHKELPVNKSSPHISQFKQDIKEIEIIKETRNPLRRKPNKNVEVFDLYKDDNLAKDINKLGVEVFKENLDIRQGPKHGGNYRSIESTATLSNHQKTQPSKADAETSQSEFKKNVEVDETSKKKHQNLRNRGRNSETERIETPDTNKRGASLRYRGRLQNNHKKSEKLIELDEHDDDTSSDSLEDKSYSNAKRRPMHGGNYRSAQLTEEKLSTTTETAKIQSRDTIRNAALILNSFAQAAPVLTTKPAYILDPSQRKYYYVDA